MNHKHKIVTNSVMTIDPQQINSFPMNIVKYENNSSLDLQPEALTHCNRMSSDFCERLGPLNEELCVRDNTVNSYFHLMVRFMNLYIIIKNNFPCILNEKSRKSKVENSHNFHRNFKFSCESEM